MSTRLKGLAVSFQRNVLMSRALVPTCTKDNRRQI